MCACPAEKNKWCARLTCARCLRARSAECARPKMTGVRDLEAVALRDSNPLALAVFAPVGVRAYPQPLRSVRARPVIATVCPSARGCAQRTLTHPRILWARGQRGRNAPRGRRMASSKVIPGQGWVDHHLLPCRRSGLQFPCLISSLSCVLRTPCVISGRRWGMGVCAHRRPGLAPHRLSTSLRKHRRDPFLPGSQSSAAGFGMQRRKNRRVLHLPDRPLAAQTWRPVTPMGEGCASRSRFQYGRRKRLRRLSAPASDPIQGPTPHLACSRGHQPHAKQYASRFEVASGCRMCLRGTIRRTSARMCSGRTVNQ